MLGSVFGVGGISGDKLENNIVFIGRYFRGYLDSEYFLGEY